MQIPLINEHLFCKYFVRLSIGNATKGFSTYGCFHPCFFYKLNIRGRFDGRDKCLHTLSIRRKRLLNKMNFSGKERTSIAATWLAAGKSVRKSETPLFNNLTKFLIIVLLCVCVCVLG